MGASSHFSRLGSVIKRRGAKAVLRGSPQGCKLSMMKRKLTVTTHEEQAAHDREYWGRCTPEERIHEVERLRIEAGKFLYEYPSRLRRVVTITWREPR